MQESMDAFSRACARVMDQENPRTGIGTLGEKTLHAVLKHYLEPDERLHEIPVDNYIADIVRDGGITEIQTVGFGRLRPKLNVFLQKANVTVVYPVIHTKWLLWIDPETGEVSRKRKSPKTGQPIEILKELVRIKPFLGHPGLRLVVMLLDVEEYRLLNGWSRDRKKGSTRFDRIPKALTGTYEINRLSDLDGLIPENLPDPFRSSDFRKEARLSKRDVQTVIHVLYHTGRIERIGKEGRFYLYSKPHGGA